MIFVFQNDPLSLPHKEECPGTSPPNCKSLKFNLSVRSSNTYDWILSPFPFILLRSLSQTAGRAPAPASNTQITCEHLQMSSWTISIGHRFSNAMGQKNAMCLWHGHLGLDSSFQTELTTYDNAELHLSPKNSDSQEILTPHLCSFLRNDLPQRTILPTWLR